MQERIGTAAKPHRRELARPSLLGRGRLRLPDAGPVSVAAIVVSIAFIAWQIGSPDWGPSRTTVGDLVPIALELLATGAAVARAAGADGRRHRIAWFCIAGSFALYLAGDGTWAWFELVQHRSPFPSLADVAYLLFYPTFMAGLLTLPRPAGQRMSLVRLGLDVTIVVVGGVMAVWYLVIAPTVAQGGEGGLSQALSLAYPVGDLVLLFGVATALIRGTRASQSTALRLMGVGGVAFVIGDVGFAHLSLSSAYQTGAWPDSCWIVALLCFVLASDHDRRTPVDDSEARAVEHDGRVSLLPYVTIIGSFVLLVQVAFTKADSTIRTLLLLVLILTGAVVTRQVTALRDNLALTRMFRDLATTDPLTGLANRRHLLSEAELEVSTADAHGTPLSLVFVDVDHFKGINDTHGHSVGDAVLEFVARSLVQHLRPADVVGRYGGDEFVLVLPGRSDSEALELAAAIGADVAVTASPVPGGPASLSLSLGVAGHVAGQTLQDLLGTADAGLYRAKQSGRGCARLGAASAVHA